ncbi:glycosyltransferase [uncultured Polaribacter sp.]|uniref:glycosyltransferase n=1 Tax=uncultured Polaribacter sp. TaxID=174711 RepID=UPI002612066D|nr:glycosyltransferase [uncultured Polaribacter sp.]
MKFLIISDAPTLYKEGKFYSYAPYVNEINLWTHNVTTTTIVSPTKYKKKLLVDSFKTKLKVSSIPAVSLVSNIEIIKTLVFLPNIFYKIFINMYKADHIHLRIPGSIGLLACFVQIFFPSKPKTVKYAGNWDPRSKQPLSYRLQKWILSNTFLTKNCKVLVYGKWENQSKNIIPFFTASYKEEEIEKLGIKDISQTINLIFVGNFSRGKQPMLAVKTLEDLKDKGFNVILNMYGDGVEFSKVQQYIATNKMENSVFLHGNTSKAAVKKAYNNSHFLLFISKSEGWPKVVAEAMFWKCLPIASNVSCVADMLDHGKRGTLVSAEVTAKEVSAIVANYLANPKIYQEQVVKAANWSQQYTLEKFEAEIKKLLA